MKKLFIILIISFLIISCNPEGEGGCIYLDACNYNPEANYDNASCEYLSCVGCLDSSACNYNPEATMDSTIALVATCIFPTICNGCDESDFFTSYLGVWSFQRKWFFAGLPVGGSYEGEEDFINTISSTNIQNQLAIPYTTEGDIYYFFVDSLGNLCGFEENLTNEMLFATWEVESYFVETDSVFLYWSWDDSSMWGYNEITGKKIE